MPRKKAAPELKPMTAKDLSIAFMQDSRAGQRFCFILGSGASRNSGIRTGREMIGEWRTELLKVSGGDQEYIRRKAERIGYAPKDWENIFRPDYQIDSRDYFVLYDLMYADTVRAGYDYMQAAMANARPSIGYYCLASILDENTSNLVITTNFDTLTEDALFFLSGKHPLVLGHERMASFLRSDMDRPVVAKIHRDMLLEPMSRKKEMRRLKLEWETALRSILPNFIPIVIGYAGGDNTLMDLLKKKDLGCRKIYWCTHTSEQGLDKNAEEVLRSQNGQWVRIDGFDQLLYQMAERLELVPNEEMLTASTQERIKKFRDTYEAFAVTNSNPIPLDKNEKPSEQALDVAAAIRSEESRREPDLKQYNDLISEGWSLYNEKKTEEATVKFTEAIALFPGQPVGYSDRGAALHSLKRYEKALADWDRAVELAPGNAKYHLSRGITLYEMKRYEEALVACDRAIELSPGSSMCYQFRSVTLYAMKRYEEALGACDRAIELDPSIGLYKDFKKSIEKVLKKSTGDALPV